MRLIDADSLIVSLGFSEQAAKWNVQELRAVLQIVNEMPTVEPDRKSGRWIHERLASTTGGSYPVVRCSVCSGTMPFEWETRFCPHCGKPMRRGEEDGND